MQLVTTPLSPSWSVAANVRHYISRSVLQMDRRPCIVGFVEEKLFTVGTGLTSVNTEAWMAFVV